MIHEGSPLCHEIAIPAVTLNQCVGLYPISGFVCLSSYLLPSCCNLVGPIDALDYNIVVEEK